MADKYHTTRSFNRILRLTLFSFLLFGVVNATFLVRNPNENEIIFETERILLECTAANSVSNPTFTITDAQGSLIVQNNVFWATRVDNSEAAYTNTSYQLLLQITISDQSRSSLSCQIFGDGMLVSEEALTLDVRSSDEPACVIRKESPVSVGDYIELGCYQGRVTGGNIVMWRQIKGNGMSSEDLTSTNSGVINQFKMKTSASLTVTAEDNGSVFQCTVMSGDEQSQCMTEQISVVVDTLTVNFSSPNNERLEVGQLRFVQCIPSDPSASVMWQHGFDGSADVQISESGSSLLIIILESSTLTNGFVLNFECIATLGQLQSTGNFQVVVEVVDLPPSTTSVPIFDSPVEFMPVTPLQLKVGEGQTVTCIPPDQSAEVVWQHDYDQSTDVQVIKLTSAILHIALPHSTTLTNGSILKFECIVTLGRRQANGTFEIVVAILPPSTSVPVTERKTTTTGYYPSTPPVMNNVTMEIPATSNTTSRDQTTALGGNDEPSGGSDDDPPMTLYFVIGGIVATILIALILIIVVAICITHSNTPKTKQIPDERSIKNSSYDENDDTYDDQGERYAAVSKANPARIVSSPDVVPYSDVTKRHVLIDEDEIYDESQNWRNVEDI